MNDVPLIKTNSINDINTSLIAIKKQLKQINEAVGLIDIPNAPDLSPYVKKTDVVDSVESGNLNPVTSNAVAGAVSSVLNNLSYFTTEINTGIKWIDGKDIYRCVWTGLTQTMEPQTWRDTVIPKTGIAKLIRGWCVNNDNATFACAFTATGETNYIRVLSYRSVWFTINTIVLEYTKSS